MSQSLGKEPGVAVVAAVVAAVVVALVVALVAAVVVAVVVDVVAAMVGAGLGAMPSHEVYFSWMGKVLLEGGIIFIALCAMYDV